MGGISLLVTDQQEGGNLIGSNGPEHIRFTNTRSGWSSEMEGYTTNDGRDAPGLLSDLVRIHEDGTEDDPVTQFWKAGDAKRLMPNDAGTGFDPAPGSNAKGPTRNSNLGKFIVSLVEAGFDDTQLNQGVGALDGYEAMVERVEQEPLKLGKARSKTADDAETASKPYFVLLVTELVQAQAAPAPRRPAPARGAAPARPAGRPANRPAPRQAAPAPAPAPASGGDDDPDTVAAELLVYLVSEAGGELPKARIPAAMMGALNGDYAHLKGIKGELVKRLNNKTFIEQVEGVAFDGKTVSLG